MRNHHILGGYFLEIFYRASNIYTKSTKDTITNKAFMSLHSELDTKILDQVSNTNQGQSTREAKKGDGTYVIGAFSKQRIIDDKVAQEIA